MKTEELKAKGLTDEQVSYVMAENGKDVQREKDRYTALKKQLDDTQATLKGFEGVDVNELKNRVTELTNSLTAETEKHKQELADRDFNDLVKQFAAQNKMKDAKDALTHLDIGALKASKNQNEDMKAAFETLKKEKSYLFDSADVPKVVGSTSGNTAETSKSQANDALRSALGYNG